MTKELTPYDHPRWRAIRRLVLDRCAWLCEIKGPLCKVKATDADHITPWRDCVEQADWFRLDNLRGSCSPCNISRASNQKHQRGWERAATDIVLVEKRPGEAVEIRPDVVDVVLDRGRLFEALAPTDVVHPGHRTAAEIAWRKLIAEVRRGEVPVGRVWIITDEADAVTKYPHHSRQGRHHGNTQETSGEKGGRSPQETGNETGGEKGGGASTSLY